LFQGQTPLFPRIFGHEAGGYVSLLNIESRITYYKSFSYIILTLLCI
jgi:hypothetical protein